MIGPCVIGDNVIVGAGAVVTGECRERHVCRRSAGTGHISSRRYARTDAPGLSSCRRIGGDAAQCRVEDPRHLVEAAR